MRYAGAAQATIRATRGVVAVAWRTGTRDTDISGPVGCLALGVVGCTSAGCARAGGTEPFATIGQAARCSRDAGRVDGWGDVDGWRDIVARLILVGVLGQITPAVNRARRRTPHEGAGRAANAGARAAVGKRNRFSRVVGLARPGADNRGIGRRDIRRRSSIRYARIGWTGARTLANVTSAETGARGGTIAGPGDNRAEAVELTIFIATSGVTGKVWGRAVIGAVLARLDRIVVCSVFAAVNARVVRRCIRGATANQQAHGEESRSVWQQSWAWK
jgi:hypothetical protein